MTGGFRVKLFKSDLVVLSSLFQTLLDLKLSMCLALLVVLGYRLISENRSRRKSVTIHIICIYS